MKNVMARIKSKQNNVLNIKAKMQNKVDAVQDFRIKLELVE